MSNSLLHVLFWLRSLCYVTALENLIEVDCVGHQAAVQWKSERSTCPLPWDPPFRFHLTGCKPSSTWCPAGCKLHQVMRQTRCAKVSYFLKILYEWQTHKGSAVANTIQGSRLCVQLCTWYGQNACLEKMDFRRLSFSPLPQPVSLPTKFHVSSDVMWRVPPVKQALMSSCSRKLKWQPVKTALVSWKPSLRMVLFLPLLKLQKGYGFICVGKHSILYCAIHYYRKKNHVSVGKVGALEIFLLFDFPPQKFLLPVLDKVNCARRIKFWFVFISCMLSLLLIPLFNCSLCWMCEAVKHSGYCLCWTM